MPQGDDVHNPNPSRSLKVIEAPLDPANQSLAEALRTTFRILKFFMVVLVVLFLASGAIVVDQNEQAVVFRFGRPVGGVRVGVVKRAAQLRLGLALIADEEVAASGSEAHAGDAQPAGCVPSCGGQ